MTNPLVGVWELVSKEEEGLFVVTDTHFVDLTVRKGRKQWPADITPTAVTDEMRAEAWRGLLFAIGGTYELTPTGGSENEYIFHYHPTINRLPRPLSENQHIVTFEGETVWGETAGGRKEVWRRIA